ncbi:MAG TPA: CPBP family intramembrane metalloprotease domain-containing protein, partial [Planctomycetaceae bacterium]|nr:CPBP family intramembrane metalloprotease domain-containing protein [Planctomycetaceae bacterium]
MNWSHVQLIFFRELNDQLRDRRTLFTITVLPLLLYPLLGTLMLQIAQFNQEHPVRVRVIGAENWPSELPLLNENGQLAFEPSEPKLKNLVEFETAPWLGTENTGDSDAYLQQVKTAARGEIKQDAVDVVLIVEPEFRQRLQAKVVPDSTPNAIKSASAGESDNSEQQESAGTDAKNPADKNATPEAPQGISTSGDGLHLVANLARDHSKIAQGRLDRLLADWKADWNSQQLVSAGVNPNLVAPLSLAETDTAVASVKKAVLWSKILPFVMLIWALTGAFYPAIDLCAGEKERGTLETLLSSPARRREIVWGKLLTIAVFSIGSALLNLLSMHVTAGVVVKQLAAQGGAELTAALGPMPFHALGWLILLLLPMAAFFSALALAVAALARSTKEGQYYLMPLLLVTLPLVALTMLPNLELNLGTSVVPVTGAVFLVRALIEGRYAEAAVHLPAVLLVTAMCCMLSLRWAIRQFESESVMFRESERWNFRLWMHQLWRDRGDTASAPEAVMCGIIIMVASFFVNMLAAGGELNWNFIAKSTVAMQIAIMLAPSLLMAMFLTRSLRRALRIHRVQPTHLAAAVFLGLAMHPSYLVLGEAIRSVYEVSPDTMLAMAQFQQQLFAQPLLAVLLVLAVLPAICEELTFRGFIFGGLLRNGGVVRAIVVSALFFGYAHGVLQQSMAACVMGLILG